MISISKAEHLASFWNRGPGELGNGKLIQTPFSIPAMLYEIQKEINAPFYPLS